MEARKQNELQEKYMELQSLKQQISALVEQKQAVDEKEAEIKMTIDSLKKLDTIKDGEDMWSTLGSSTFVQSGIKDRNNVLVAVGAGVVVKESVPKAIELLEERAKDIEAVGAEVVNQANTFLQRVNQLEPELQKLAEQAK